MTHQHAPNCAHCQVTQVASHLYLGTEASYQAEAATRVFVIMIPAFSTHSQVSLWDTRKKYAD